MDSVLTRQPDYCGREPTDTPQPTTDAAASVNPWAAPRAHYARVKRILSWQSCVFQRGALLIKPHKGTEQDQVGS
jgi:hypothetical protein